MQSFQNADSTAFVGLSKLRTLFTREPVPAWCWQHRSSGSLLVPIAATLIGLVYAVLVDRTRTESLSKALVFIPMAISMVGASIIWRFVYDYRPDRVEQIGLANQLLKSLGLETYQFLLHAAVEHAVPHRRDDLDPGRLRHDGALGVDQGHPRRHHRGRQARRRVAARRCSATSPLPSIRPGLIVVLTTIAIGTLKVFDIVRTMTGGNFDTSVVANEFYTRRSAPTTRASAPRWRCCCSSSSSRSSSTTSSSCGRRSRDCPEPGRPLDPEGEELPRAREAAVAPGRRRRSSASRIWASVAAAIIAILWTIPTVGLLIT